VSSFIPSWPKRFQRLTEVFKAATSYHQGFCFNRLLCFVCSVFAGGAIIYPKREFLTDDDNDEKEKQKPVKVSSTVNVA